jgi:hypothetical protein
MAGSAQPPAPTAVGAEATQQSPWQLPQSPGQVPQLSAWASLKGLFFSRPWQMKSPHSGQLPQSPGQLLQLSLSSEHFPSPHAQAPQSALQV